MDTSSLLEVIEDKARIRNHEVIVWAMQEFEKPTTFLQELRAIPVVLDPNTFAPVLTKEQSEIVKQITRFDAEWRRFTIAELNQKLIGTKFVHARLGKGVVCDDRFANMSRHYMLWESGETDYFVQDSSPWTELMREL